MSMKPDDAAQPEASSSRSPRRFGPISVITPDETATSARRPTFPVPSSTVPPRMTRSAAIGDELQEIAVRVTDIEAASMGAAAPVSRPRALDHFRPGIPEQRLQRLLRSLPHEAQVAAGRLGRRRPEGEVVLLPRHGTVEVDHLGTGVDRHDGFTLGDIEAEGAVEGHHRPGVLHGEGHVVDTGDTSRGNLAKSYSRAQLVALILWRSGSGRAPSDSSTACLERGNVLSVCG